MRKILVILLLGVSGLFAYEAQSLTVTFKAFKTPLKKGVAGHFDKVIVSSKKSASLQEMLLTTVAKVDTTSVNTNNSARDAKLIKSFFLVQNNKTIQAKIVAVEKDVIFIALTLNGTTKQIPLHYTLRDSYVEASGVIDLGDFGMLPSLTAINKACYELHKGKTWQDVAIGFHLGFK